MTDDSADERQSGDASDDVTDDTQLDDILDRLESSLSETDDSAADPRPNTRDATSLPDDFGSSTGPSDPSTDPTDSSTKPADSSTDPTDSSTKPADPSTDPTDSSTDPADPATGPSDPSATTPESTGRQPAAERATGGRLWDDFAETRQPGEESSTEADPSAEPTGFEFGAVEDPESDAATDDDRAATDTAETDDSASTSFRGILNRISHRLGSAGGLMGSTSASSAAPDSQAPGAESDTAAETSTETPTATAQSSGSQTDRQQATGAGAGRPRGSQASVSIDQVLQNIDMFGRATASSQVLLLSPTTHSVTNEIYRRVLLPDDGTGQNLLLVSAIQSQTEQLPAVRAIPEWTHGKTGVIEVGQSVLRPSQPTQGPDLTVQLDVYKQITNFQSLAKIGVNVSHITSRWGTDHRSTVVGVHTLSSIQQYVGNETMFQFLFTLKGQLNSMGVRGFYHMDPAAHTQSEINTINSAFDIVVTVDSDGSIDIQ